MQSNQKHDVSLTIVPEPTDEVYNVLDTVVDDGRNLPRPVFAGSTTPKTPLRRVTPSPYAPAVTPAPAPSRLPTAVAGLVGGAMLGGAGVAVLGTLLVGAVTVVGAGAAGAWWMTSAPTVAAVHGELEPVADASDEALPAPVEVDAGDDLDGTDEDDWAFDDADDAPKAAPSGSDDGEAPVAAPAAPAPVAPVVAPEEAAPAAAFSVKLLSDPPAAVVTLDGVDIGRTPLKTEMVDGTHTVTIESGKASGTFTIDTSDADRFCFASRGRKVSLTSCN